MEFSFLVSVCNISLNFIRKTSREATIWENIGDINVHRREISRVLD
jgi:hypothetical protein